MQAACGCLGDIEARGTNTNREQLSESILQICYVAASIYLYISFEQLILHTIEFSRLVNVAGFASLTVFHRYYDGLECFQQSPGGLLDLTSLFLSCRRAGLDRAHCE